MPSWQVLLVTGGYGSGHYTDSTELLVPGSGSWRLTAGLLPRPMDSMKIASVDNTLFLTGAAFSWLRAPTSAFTIKNVYDIMLNGRLSPRGLLRDFETSAKVR